MFINRGMDKENMIYVCVCVCVCINTHTQWNITQPKQDKIMPFAATCMDLETVIPRD